ncbi:hypothetical protein AQUCO_03400248v1 [Aquilegia coerulea]|uniref:F-box domain-containing protein n=1 Tax=Aquilegia coerulea TaxID=218851 RepID=A0A2G5CY40_AQUCA|nr:hypothetical protein AQUCO_03400248v1 [Aquilegia coerulea]
MQGGGISVLPDVCISNILSFTSPRDAGAWSLVSSAFKLAADSNFVWEKFLPLDMEDIISRSLFLNLNQLFLLKKQLYLHHAMIHFSSR